MPAIFGSRHFGRRLGTIFNRVILGLFLLVTQDLVSDLLAQDYYKLYARSAVSTARIETPYNTGLGVAIGDGSLLITCAHVIKNSPNVIIKSGNGNTIGSVVAYDEDEDLAIIALKGLFLVPTHPSRSRVLPKTETYVVMAGMKKEPMDMDLRSGRVMAYFSNVFPNIVISQAPEFGFSGGPVLDADGQLVGITRGFANCGEVVGTEVIAGWKIAEYLVQAIPPPRQRF